MADSFKYFTGTQIPRVGYPVIIVISNENEQTHAMYSEWHLYVVPVHGGVKDYRTGRVVHNPPPAGEAPPAIAAALAIELLSLEETVFSMAKNALYEFQARDYEKSKDIAIFSDSTFKGETQKIVIRLWLTRQPGRPAPRKPVAGRLVLPH